MITTPSPHFYLILIYKKSTFNHDYNSLKGEDCLKIVKGPLCRNKPLVWRPLHLPSSACYILPSIYIWTTFFLVLNNKHDPPFFKYVGSQKIEMGIVRLFCAIVMVQ